MMEYISHPAENRGEIVYPRKLLKTHLIEVGRRSYQYLEELEVENKDLLARCAYIAGASHDFGKYTTYFQNYLNSSDRTKTKISGHSLISSVFGAYCVLTSFKVSLERFALLVFMAIIHHHGNLTNPSYHFDGEKIWEPEGIDWNDQVRDRIRIIKAQIIDLKNNSQEISAELAEVFTESGLFPDFTPDLLKFLDGEWLATINVIIKTAEEMQSEGIRENSSLDYYFYLLLIFSALVDGDKRDAGRISETLLRPAIGTDIVLRKVASLELEAGDASLKSLRASLFQSVKDRIENLNINEKILTLTAPTGSGKTLSALYAALRLRERLVKGGKPVPRIIYSLPYTSIIDQNFRVFEELLESEPLFRKSSQRFIIKHHHLSDIDTRAVDENIPLDVALALTESWDSEIIVTTFVQIFESVIGYKNKFLRKLHRVANSIIILDEIQSLDVRLWPVIGETIKQAARILNCHFILMTATQPLILPSEEKVEIGFDQFQIQINRTQIVFMKERLEESETENMLYEALFEASSVLAIRNTIRLSINTFLHLEQRIKNSGINTEVFYLSTNIIPKERVRRVEAIRHCLLEKRKILVISTQVIEAGIDLDFDRVFRDIGPIDSIIQAAGRCNRNNLNGNPGIVTIINPLDDVSQKNPKYPLSAALVYGSIHLDISLGILESMPSPIMEQDFGKILHSYFERLGKSAYYDSPATEYKLFKNMKKLNFFSQYKSEDEVSSFSVIDRRRPMVDLFVAKDQECISSLEWYRTIILAIDNPIERKIAFLDGKGKFKSCIISVEEKRAERVNAIALTGDKNLFLLESVLAGVNYDDRIGLSMRGAEEAIVL